LTLLGRFAPLIALMAVVVLGCSGGAEISYKGETLLPDGTFLLEVGADGSWSANPD